MNKSLWSGKRVSQPATMDMSKRSPWGDELTVNSIDQSRLQGVHRLLHGRVRRVFHTDRSALREAPQSHPLGPDAIWEWVRAILPAEASQSADIVCDSWNHPRLRVQIVTDAAGRLIVANHGVLRDAMRLIDSGATVVVQVCSADATTPGGETAATIRIWLFNRQGPRAVEADTVEDILLPDERDAYTQSGTRFETGWQITGEPGGRAAGGTTRRAGGRGVRGGSGRHFRWLTAHPLGA